MSFIGNPNLQNIGINKKYPAVQFGGTETGSQAFEDREIAGALYRAQNATYNEYTNQWLLVDATKPAIAFVINANGTVQILKAPAGTSPFTWAISNDISSTLGAPAFNVKNYGAKGDGVTDDTAAIQSAYAALVALGYGTLYFPPGIYAISSTLNIGNGNTTASTVSNITVLGAGAGSADSLRFNGQFPPQVLTNPLTSRIKWIGGSGANTTVVKINGPIDSFSMANIEIEGNGVAGVGISESSLTGSQFNNVLVRNCLSGHWYFYGNGTLVGSSQNVYNNCGVVTTQNCGATAGLVFGGVGSDITNLNSPSAQSTYLHTFIGIAVFVSNSTGAVAADFRVCDNIVFLGGTLQGDTGAAQCTQNPNFTSYPADIQFLGMNCVANNAANTFPVRGTLLTTPSFLPWLVWPFGDNTSPVPNPAVQPHIQGMTVNGQFFGPTFGTGAPLLFTGRSTSAAVANTTTETTFSAPSYTLPAKSILDNTQGSQNGAILRVKCNGSYSTTATPTLRLRMYFAGVLVADTTAITTLNNASNQSWHFQADLMAFTATQLLGSSPIFSIASNLQLGSGPIAAVGLSAGGAITVTATWGTASASNTIVMGSLSVELMKSLSYA